MVTSKAVFQPEIPSREIDREAKKVEKKLDEIDETVAPSIDTREMQRDIDKLDGPELGGGGFDAASRPGGGGGGTPTPVPMGLSRGGGGSLLSKGGAASAAKAAIPVALAGAGLFAIKGMHDSLAKASPALQQMDTMFAAAIQNFRAPFGRALAGELEPSANSLLEASVEFRRTAEEQGFGAAFQQLGENFFGPRIGDLMEQDVANPIQDAIGDIRAGGEIGAVTGGIFGGQLGAQLGGALGSTFTAALIPLASPIRTLVGLFDDFVGGMGDIGFPDLTAEDLLGDVGWPDVPATLVANPITWPNIAAGMVLDELDFPDLSAPHVVDSIGWPKEIGALAILNPITWPNIAAAALLGEIDWPSLSGQSITEQLLEQARQAQGGGMTLQEMRVVANGSVAFGQTTITSIGNMVIPEIDWSQIINPVNLADFVTNTTTDSGGGGSGNFDPNLSGPGATPPSGNWDFVPGQGWQLDIPGFSSPSGDAGGVSLPGPIDDLGPIGLQSGGRITQTGTARVHRGELVASPDRLVSDLAAAISQAGGGGDSSRVVNELQRLRDELSGDGDERVVRELRRVREAVRALRDDMNTSTDVTRLGR